MGTKKNNLGVRIAMAVIGIALTAVSVGLQKISGLGVDPFSVIIFGFSNAFHATYQTVFFNCPIGGVYKRHRTVTLFYFLYRRTRLDENRI